MGSDQGDVAYISLPEHPGAGFGLVKKLVRLSTLIPEYDGPEVMFDFADGNKLIGIEILSV